MTAPGGAGTLRKAPFPRARTTGFSHKVGALALLGSDPSLATGPMLQGVSYVHQGHKPTAAVHKKRNTRWSAISWRSWAAWTGSMQTFTAP